MRKGSDRETVRCIHTHRERERERARERERVRERERERERTRERERELERERERERELERERERERERELEREREMDARRTGDWQVSCVSRKPMTTGHWPRKGNGWATPGKHTTLVVDLSHAQMYVPLPRRSVLSAYHTDDLPIRRVYHSLYNATLISCQSFIARPGESE